MVPWDDAQKEAFLRSQWELQTAHYRRHYPQAAFLVVLDHDTRIGRLYVDRTPEDIHILDIAVVPERRGHGLGTVLMRELITEADASRKTVTLYVEKFNPAQRLYQRLGFLQVKDEGVYWMLVRSPETSATT